jgi:hypothetical protein
MQPSPIGRRVGIRIVTFEACSGFKLTAVEFRAEARQAKEALALVEDDIR